MKTIFNFPLVMLLLCAGACRSPQTERTTKIESGRAAAGATIWPSPTIAPAPTSAATARALSAIRQLATARSFRAAMTTTRASKGPLQTSLEVVLPNRFRVTNEQYQLIIIGPDFYLKLPGTTWQKTAANLEVTHLTDPKILESYLSLATEILTLNPQVVDQTAVQVYQASLRFSPSSKPHLTTQPFTVKLWVRETDGQLRRLEGTAANSQSTTTVVYYDHGVRLKIDPPIE